MARDPGKLRKAYEAKLGKKIVDKLTDAQIGLLSKHYNSLSNTEQSNLDTQIFKGYQTELHEIANSFIEENKPSNDKLSVYTAADKFVDDKKEFAKEQEEKLDEKLTETSDAIMSAIDELIAADKKRFEDFKKQQEEESFRKQTDAKIDDYQREQRVKEIFDKKKKKLGLSQYKSPIGPQPMQGPKEAKKGLIGTREVLNDDQIAEKYGTDKPAPVPAWGKDKKKSDEDEPWESEVQDQLGTKLDELIEQVRNEPLPQPNKTKRRKTRGKKPLERKKYLGKMGLGASLQEIQENVIETRKALFELYKLEKERFEFKKKIDAKLTQELSAKLREKDLEKPAKEKKKKKNSLRKALEDAGMAGLIAGITALALPLIIGAIKEFLPGYNKDDGKENDPTFEPPVGLAEPWPSFKGGGEVPKRRPSLRKSILFAGGGKVPGKGPNKDTVPAMLAPGEFVMSRGAVKKYGVKNLMAMNASGGGTNRPTYKGMIPGYVGGGPVIPQAGTGKDFWTLVAVAAREDSDPQSWADIAQSIYNRKNSKVNFNQTNSASLASYIVAREQYEPTWKYPYYGIKGQPNPEWYQITDIHSAAAATGLPIAKLQQVAQVIRTPKYQKEAARFVGGRTDFMGGEEVANFEDGDVRRGKQGEDNFFGWFVGGGDTQRKASQEPASVPPIVGSIEEPNSKQKTKNTGGQQLVQPKKFTGPKPIRPQGFSFPSWLNPMNWFNQGSESRPDASNMVLPGNVPPPPPVPNPRRYSTATNQIISSIGRAQTTRRQTPKFEMPRTIASVGSPAMRQPGA